MSGSENQEINKAEVLILLKTLVEEINALGEWNSTNAYKLKRFGDRRHGLAGYLFGFGILDAMSVAYGTDETDRDISIAQETRPKRKRDGITNERFYYNGIRHLRDEIEEYITKLESTIEKEQEKPD